MDKTELLNHIKRKLIIFCQALLGEPLYNPERTLMSYVVRATREAGSPMIRANMVRDAVGIRREIGLPVIGLIRQVYEKYDRHITPTIREVGALAEAGADITVTDYTDGKCGDGLSPWGYTGTIKKRYPDQILIAGTPDYQKGTQAWKSGINLVSVTMNGYTDYTPRLEGPDLEPVRRLSGELSVPVIGEDRVHTPGEAVKMLDMEAWAVIVGGTIIWPLETARRFMKVVNGRMAQWHEKQKNGKRERDIICCTGCPSLAAVARL